MDKFGIKQDNVLTSDIRVQDVIPVFHVKLFGKNAKKAFNFNRKKRNQVATFEGEYSITSKCTCGYDVKFEN